MKDALNDHSLSRGRFTLNRAAVAAACAVLAALPSASWALGLGKLNVQSALGESLRAEIELSSLTPEEGASLQVRVASPETYRAAGVDYNQVLSTTSISLQRRADGRAFLRIGSDRSVQEPFVDVILDLSWSSGRLVREYTLLFDPPSSRAVAPVTSPVVESPAFAPAPPPAATVVTPPALASEAASKPRRVRPAPAPAAEPVAPVVAAPPPPAAPVQAGDGTVRVKSGDSLSSIASRTAHPAVSLDQMLVGLYRSNPDAFMGNNMNRLKSGVVLNVPTASEASTLSREEARKVILTQSADFAAYRQNLAASVSPSGHEPAQRQAKGKVEAEVKDQKQAVVNTPDKLTLSKGSAVASSAPAAEDRLAKSRAKAESAARVAELSKNLDELRKLKDKAVSAPASAVLPAAKPVASAPAAVPPAPSKPAPVQAPASLPTPVASAVEPKSVAASEVASSALTAVAQQASAPASVAAVASAASLPSLSISTAPLPVEEPGLLESLNPMLLAAGGAGVALLAGLAMFMRARRRSDSGETSFLESRLQPDSFFGASGGQRVDTRDASGAPSSMSYSLSQLDAIGDVDPVAEADVYLAYGRDLQAEEILKEALRSTPDRLSLRIKLLEVYAKRRDIKGFEQLASQIYTSTQGQGEDWEKVQDMGLEIDAENPLYHPGGAPLSTPARFDAYPDMLGASTVPHSVMPTPSVMDAMAPASMMGELPGSADLVNLDLDISAQDAQEAVSDSVQAAVTQSGAFPALHLPADEFPPMSSPATGPAPLPALDAQEEDEGLHFDLSTDDMPQAQPTGAQPLPTFDMSSISLDLDAPDLAAPAEPAPMSVDVPFDENDPMARKLELAEEFRQIGDADGARELLQEVLDQVAEGPLRAKAQSLMAGLH